MQQVTAAGGTNSKLNTYQKLSQEIVTRVVRLKGNCKSNVGHCFSKSRRLTFTKARQNSTRLPVCKTRPVS